MEETKISTLHGLFAAQAKKTPNQIAVIAGSEQLSYHELEVRASQVARLLQQHGVGPAAIVGIMLRRSIHILIAMLGILKAGAAYLPVDPDYPAQRINYMLKDSGVRLLLTEQDITGTQFVGEKLDITDETIFRDITEADFVDVQPDNLAYLIYTSGSTGNPKGVMIEHQSVCNMIAGMTAVIDFSPGKTLLSLAPIAFDMSVFEIWVPLVKGGTVLLGTEQEQQSVEALKTLFAAHDVQMVMMTPSRLQLLKNTGELAILSQTTEIMVGGEAFPPLLLQSLVKYTCARIYNLYGPTETTVYSTAKELTPNCEITIGRPLVNTYIYILNENREFQPEGIAGELCIGGEGLARGYWNRSELTTEKFVPNPFRPGEQMYRTGDLAKWRPDGEIDYLGRVDQQVKVRGYRIELGEIETLLVTYPGVQAAVVVPKEDQTGDKYLCAYFVSLQEQASELLRQYLGQRLPEYMVPSHFVRLKEIPLTANGKIDRAALPEPQGRTDFASGYQAPDTNTEQIIVSIWAKLLRTQFIGRDDNFFALGGHSLTAMYFLAKLHKETGIALSLKELFDNPEVKQLARIADTKGKTFVAPISKVLENLMYSVSPAQKRFFFLHRLGAGSTVYNVPIAVRISGKLDTAVFETVLRQLTKRHELLRTSFALDSNEVNQKIEQDCVIDFQYLDAGQEETRLATILENFIRPFELAKAPLLRMALVKTGPDNYIWLTDMHHIITDGISVQLLLQEFFVLYASRVGEVPYELKALPIQFKDYVQWQQAQKQHNDIRKQAIYWQEMFAAAVPLLDLPLDYPRPAIRNYQGEQVSQVLDHGLVKALNSLIHTSGVTLFTILFASFSILLAKYSGQQDIVIGTATAGRRHSDIQNMLGPFVNTLAIRNFPDREQSFLEFIAAVQDTLLAAFANQDYQFEDLVEELAMTREASRNPLFDALFLMEEKPTWVVPGLTVSTYDLAPFHKVSMMDITLLAEFSEEELELKVQYSTELFRRESMEKFIRHYIKVLESVVANPSVKIANIGMLTETEKRQLTYEFNDTYDSVCSYQTIQELFENQVLVTPQAAAVIAGTTCLSYLELNRQANQLACVLRQQGVGPDYIVGIMVRRSPAMLVAILAVIKAGGAYLPLDPDFPAQRIGFMLQDSGAGLLITEVQHVANHDYQVKSIYVDKAGLFVGTGENPAIINQPGDLAYVIYTSGSTGVPKGVMLEHKSVLNFIGGMRNRIDFSPGQRILNVTTISFDIFVLETLVPLCAGATVVIANEEEQHSVEALCQLLVKQQVTMVQLTPSRLQVLKNADSLDCLAHVSDILLGGEVLSPSLLAALAPQTTARMYNMYGPTETTVWSMVKELTDQEITIGQPISNTQIYILDPTDQLQPIGVAGELCIGGQGLARGYWNRPELTVQKFVPNPFRPAERMYRTGDLAKWRPDGEVEFLGRIDHQVKVRGYRIELGEIETCLLQYSGMQEIVVTATEDKSGDKYLCAYFTAIEQQQVAKIREYVSQKLPDYMIPSYFVKLENLPLTPNGKIDRNALPKPEVGASEAGTLPQTGSECLLTTLWQELLGVSQIYTEDNFFDLGGHSLKAMSFLARLHKETGIELSLRQFFTSPTIKATAEYLMSQTAEFDLITVLPEQPYYALSAVQKRMYFLTQYADNGVNYNIPFTVSLEGDLDREVFEKALQQLVNRHEVLRTSFAVLQGELVQKIQPTAISKVEYQDVSGKDEDVVQQELAALIRPFDFTQAPLMRSKLLKLTTSRYSWLVDIHHSIADGASIAILLRDFAKLYQQQCDLQYRADLPELKVQYKDFAAWQNQRLASERLKSQQHYWQQVFAEEVPVLVLPTDYNRPENRSFSGKVVKFSIGCELTAQIKKVAKTTGTTDFMVLLAAFNVLLFKYCGQEDIIVGTVTSGRSHADIEDVVGVFINTLALRSQPAGSKSVVQYLGEIKDIVLAAFDNQDYQFEQLVDELAIKREVGRNPLFDSMFLLQNNPQVCYNAAGLTVSNLVMGAEDYVAQMDLLLEAEEQDRQYVFRFNYATELFASSTVARLAAHFNQLLEQIVAKPQASLSELKLISVAEETQILTEFNNPVIAASAVSTIHQLVEQQAAVRPAAPAVSYQGMSMSYAKLNNQANLLAQVLREKGVGPNIIVGLLVDRSFSMMVGILGILKAGGAYLPIDPKYPEARIEYLLKDSNARILLTKVLPDMAINFDGLTIDITDECFSQGQENNPAVSNTCSDLAYVIYTSGSTGLPKGVMIEHQSVINLVQALAEHICFAAGKRVVSLATYSFDMSIPELLLPLVVGMTVVIAGEQEQNDISAFQKLLVDEAIDIMQITPARLALLHEGNRLDCVKTVRELIVGAEPFPLALKDKLSQAGECNVYNIYGPTETTVWSLIKKVNSSQPVTLGRPLANTQVYIVDRYNALQPIGVVGELCIAGNGLARGYLNRDELTSEKFVPNPFVPGTRMYRTGDLAKWTETGEIQFIGRKDEQVKIRGYRIELGEIQACLAMHPAVKTAVVVDKIDRAGLKCLCAYYVAAGHITTTEFRNYLSQSLPEYMIPSYFIKIETIPLTPNGKVNRQALPAPEQGGACSTLYQEPRNEVESDIATVWAEVLRVGQVGVDDNFFEIGGDSLKAILVAAKLADLGCTIGVADLFKYPTIANLSEWYSHSQTALPAVISSSSRIKWLPGSVLAQGDGSTKPRLRLFCLAFAGASAAVYASWDKHLAPDIELCLIELPGRGIRLQESLQHDFEKVLEDIYKSAEPWLNSVPYAIFGHSLGALLGYELVCKLIATGYPAPVHLFLSGTVIPEKLQQQGASQLSDTELKRLIDWQEDRLGQDAAANDIWQTALPVLRADYSLIDSYGARISWSQQEKLPCDVTILNGTAEGYEAVSSADEWQQYTQGLCNMVKITGGHMFVREQAGKVAKVVNDTLLKKQ